MCATCGCMGNKKAAKKAPAASKGKACANGKCGTCKSCKGSKGKKKAAKGKMPAELLAKFAKKK